MVGSSFLDTGVVFGYCVPLDRHHSRCAGYVADADATRYLTETVEQEFQRMKRDRVQELSTAVLDHRRSVANADLDESLGPTDRHYVRNRVLDRNNEAAQFLYRFYDDLDAFVNRDGLLRQLRELARDVESVMLQRKASLDETVQKWSKRDDHPAVESALSEVHRTDRRLCVEARDLACNTGGTTELATVNPRDFVDEGREELILEATALDAIRDLAVRR